MFLLQLFLFLTFSANSGVHSIKCQVREISNNPCQIEGTCWGGINDVMRLDIQRLPCYHQQVIDNNNQYYYYDSTPPSNPKYEVFLKVVGIYGQIAEDPLQSLSNMKEEIKTLAISTGNMILVPSEVYGLSNLTEFRITSNNVENINLYNFVHLNQLKTINASHNAISLIENNMQLSAEISSVEIIDLSFNTITIVPDNSFLLYTKLLFLDLSNNLLTHFDVLTFEGIARLEILNVSNNNLLEFGQSLVRFSRLKRLDINHNDLTEIKGYTFKGLSSLEILNISSNYLEVIDEKSFATLQKLQQLDFSYNDLNIIGKNLFKNNTDLKKLDLSYNKIEQIQDNSFKYNGVVEFYINNNSLTGSIKEATWAGICTTDLNLSDGKLIQLDEMAFSSLGSTLQSLNLSRNFIATISNTSFISLSILLKLDLSHNAIKNTDFDKQDLKNVTELYVNNNKIEKISRHSLTNLFSLVKLDLSNNKIADIVLGSFLDMKNLETLILNNNPLTKSFSDNLFIAMNNLQYLYVTNAQFLFSVNRSFSGLHSVKLINSSYGLLQNIAYETFSSLVSVEIIDLSHNMLHSFIVNTSHLENIQELYLNNNNLTTITVNTFSNLKQLRKLNLAFNKIVTFDKKSLQTLEQLNMVDLTSNTAMEIDLDAFSNLISLSQVSLDNIKNPINSGTTPKSIKVLYLSRCNISIINMIHVNSIKNVLKLDLNSNKIRFLDKDSFGEMSFLNTLDLSCNLIDYIQPGIFLHTNMIHILNLQGNNLHSIEFGVLDGLNNLRTLNLSCNSIKVFSDDILHSVPLLRELLLDNNYITNFNWRKFAALNLKKISIGGNPIPCDRFLNFFGLDANKTTLTAEVLDFHSENVKGIKCKTYSNQNKTILSHVESNDVLALNKSLLENFIKTVLNENDNYMSNLTNNLIDVLSKMQSHNSSRLDHITLNLNNTLYSYLENVSKLSTQLLVEQRKFAELNNEFKNETYHTIIIAINQILSELRSMNNREEHLGIINIKDNTESEGYNYNQQSVYHSDIKRLSNDMRILLCIISMCLGGFVLAKALMFVYKKAKRLKNIHSSGQSLPTNIEMD